MAPSRVGKYEVLERIGRGGAGTVFRARDLSTSELVALKSLGPNLAQDPQFLARFQREARAGLAVRHDGAARFLDAFEERGSAYLVFELVSGGSLADAIRARGRLSPAEAARVLAPVARALAAIHEAGLIHRDVKPSNVLIDASGSGKLADFGLVGFDSSVVSPAGDLTATGEIVGTLEYIAPEQANGEGLVDGRADLYALGATLFHAITGEPPFAGEGMALLKKHLLERPRSPRDLAPVIPRSLERLVLALLEKSPANRPSIASVASALHRIASGKEDAPPRRPWLAVGIVALALVVAGALIAASLSAKRPKPTASPSPSASPVASTAKVEACLARALELYPVESKKALASIEEGLAAPRDDARLTARLFAARALVRQALHESEGAKEDLAKARALSADERFVKLVRCHVDGRSVDTAEVEGDESEALTWVIRAEHTLAVRHDATRALEEAERALSIADRADARELKIQCLLRFDRDVREKALDEANELCRRAPGWATAYLTRIMVRDSLSLPGVEDDVAMAQKLDAASWEVCAFAAEVASHGPGGEARAIEVLTKGLDRIKEGEAHASLLAVRSQHRLFVKDVAGATEDIHEALRLGPGLAGSWGMRAALRCRTKDYAGAIADANRALALSPDEPAALAARAEAYARTERYDEARVDAEKAVFVAPGYSWASYARAVAGEGPQALLDLDKAIVLDRRFAEPFVLRAVLRGAVANDADGAAEDFHRAVTIQPEILDELDYYNVVYVVQIEIRRHGFENAARGAARLQKLEPQNPMTWVTTRVVARALGETEKARDAGERAIATVPAGVERELVRAHIHREDGRLDDALQVIEGLLKDAPDNPRARVLRGEIYLDLNQPARARDDALAALASGDEPRALRLASRALVALGDPERAAEMEARLKRFGPPGPLLSAPPLPPGPPLDPGPRPGVVK